MDSLRRLVGPDGLPLGQVAFSVGRSNVLRDEFDVDLDDIRAAGRPLGGQLNAARLYLDEHATLGLIQTTEVRRFGVIVTSGDADVKFVIDPTCYTVEDRADVIVVVSQNTDFKPVLETANTYGLRTVAITPGSHSRSDVPQNTATHAMTLDESATGDGQAGRRLGRRQPTLPDPTRRRTDRERLASSPPDQSHIHAGARHASRGRSSPSRLGPRTRAGGGGESRPE